MLALGMRAAAPLVQVFRRGTLRHVLAKMGISGAPSKEVRDRINTWFTPIYGYTEEEELGSVSADDVQSRARAVL